MSAQPTISIVVVCRNPGPRLHEALASVWQQRGASVDLIVVDGESTDGTREWLDAHRARLATLISERDSGVYEAMNKGIAAARGTWLLFLGADDRLADENVLADASTWLAQSKAGVVGGEAVYNDGRRYRLGSPIKPIRRNFVHHQAAFYRADLFNKHGGYDPVLKIMGDYDLNLRLWKTRVQFEAMPRLIALCGAGGASDSGNWRGYREEIQVRHRHNSFGGSSLWDIGSILRFVRKKLLRAFS